MNAQQITLIQTSFIAVDAISDVAAELFYARLFELDPSLRRLFQNDMKSQGRKLMSTLKVAVNGLRNLDAIVPVLQNLGQRHVHYGVTESHYAVVGSALLWTLEQGLGEAFTPKVKEAWATLYGLVAQVMLQAAAEVVVGLDEPLAVTPRPVPLPV